MPGSIILHEYERVIDQLRSLLDEQGLTQKQLAEKTSIDPSHVSRSLNGEREASYEKIYRMWKVLKQEAEDTVTAEEVMVPEIEWVYPDETVGEVGKRAMEMAYTQFPVREEGDHIGWITTERLAGEDSDSPIRPLVHREGFTTVPPYLDVETIQEHLNGEYRAMLVEDEGEFLGIVTPYDLVNFTLKEDREV
ncbi:CBS domain-containing protein [Natrinema halophilum]|uniref:CBS domain-containing protein n=1 Tax=Natrinema halophilum TaxID=1699371 RepID=A0A7D5L3M8_9EURY|nr:CBS domain-containing protein [Natrinema halophilum]QLG51005.1 CBS domain-containing protein [Natrinema halophilum]